MDREDLRAFVGRNWACVAEAKLEYWAERFQRDGGGPARLASTLLLEHALRLGVLPLNEADRAADLAHHAVVRDRLDRAARAFSSR